jgi:RNA polymerase sigma-70 factor (ECF subfamily)
LAHRRDWGYVLAATARVTGDLDLAEDCVQEAYVQALTAWRREIPARPGAWLTTVARRRALNLVRRDATLRHKLPLLASESETPQPADTDSSAPDERLALIFTCCHPAIAAEAQVALTLRLLCGLTTVDVARAFLVNPATMAARITRAKKKISQAHIPYRVPDRGELPERLEPVLDVVHLVFTTGHTSPSGPGIAREDFIDRALDLARMLHDLLPDSGEATGLLALLLLTDARRRARVDGAGRLVLLAHQDRTTWDSAAISDGLRLLRQAGAAGPPGRFTLMAAIAAVHDQAPTWEDTNWPRILGLYDALLDLWPSPVVALNRAVAVGFAHGVEAGLAELDRLAEGPRLAGYPYLAVARAHTLRGLGRRDEAELAYHEAALLSQNPVEAAFLEAQIRDLGGTQGTPEHPRQP